MNTSNSIPQSAGDRLSPEMAGPAIGFLVPRMTISNRALPGNFLEVVNGMIAVVDEILTRPLSARTREEFRGIRTECLGQYAHVVLAIGEFARVVVDPVRAEMVCSQLLKETAKEFRTHGPAMFGECAPKQAEFTIWLFGKTNALVAGILAKPAPEHLREKDRELAKRFSEFGLYSAFHLDCLRKALDQKIPIHPDVVDELVEGLRSAVNAYAIAREAYAFRTPRNPLAAKDVERGWDDEDEALMNIYQEPIPHGL